MQANLDDFAFNDMISFFRQWYESKRSDFLGFSWNFTEGLDFMHWSWFFAFLDVKQSIFGKQFNFRQNLHNSFTCKSLFWFRLHDENRVDLTFSRKISRSVLFLFAIITMICFSNMKSALDFDISISENISNYDKIYIFIESS